VRRPVALHPPTPSSRGREEGAFFGETPRLLPPFARACGAAKIPLVGDEGEHEAILDRGHDPSPGYLHG
jgi:hypothetical protein